MERTKPSARPTPALPVREGEAHTLPTFGKGGAHTAPTLGEEEARAARGAVHGMHTANTRIYARLKGYSKEMRAEPTTAERVLWRALRGNKAGTHFRRQHVLGNFIVDLVSLDRRLVIEVDGDMHDHQQEEDALRTEWLNQIGFHVLRFRNEEVLRHMSSVVETIKEAVAVRSSLRNSSLPSGEG